MYVCVHVNIYMNTRIPDFLVKNNENIVLIDIKIIIFNQKNRRIYMEHYVYI